MIVNIHTVLFDLTRCTSIFHFHCTGKLDAGPPTILNGYMPADVLGVRPMEQVAFTVAAAGQNLKYRWIKASGELPQCNRGVDSETLVIPRVSVEDAGMYQCEVTNEFASVTSNFARLTVGMCIYQLAAYILYILALSKAVMFTQYITSV